MKMISMKKRNTTVKFEDHVTKTMHWKVDKSEWGNACKETINQIKNADLGDDELQEYARAKKN